jgi:hypothetical protein
VNNNRWSEVCGIARGQAPAASDVALTAAAFNSSNATRYAAVGFTAFSIWSAPHWALAAARGLHKALKLPCAIMTGSIIILAPQPEFLGGGSAVNGAVSNR